MMIEKGIFIVQRDQNTNSFTKLHKYPGLPHFNSLQHSIPNQQVAHLHKYT